MSIAHRSMGFVLAVLIALPVLAAPVEDEPGKKPAEPPRSLLSLTPEQAQSLRPCDQEIRALLLREREDVAALVARMKASGDDLEALRIQKEIGVRKQRTEIGILETQAKFADLEGRSEQAAAIRDVVDRMKARLAATLDDAGSGE